MDRGDRKETVYTVTGRVLGKFNNTLDTSRSKALLAHLRNSIGHDISHTVDVWHDVFAEMPIEFLSKNGVATKEENSIFVAIQLYAMHQQGLQDSVHTYDLTDGMQELDSQSKMKMNTRYYNIGHSLRALREPGEFNSTDQRFNAMITASGFSELIVHLRHLISILKSKEKAKVKINYALLAEDLFWYQNGKREQIRLRWGQSYYSSTNREMNSKEK